MKLKIEIPDPLYNVDIWGIRRNAERLIETEFNAIVREKTGQTHQGPVRMLFGSYFHNELSAIVPLINKCNKAIATWARDKDARDMYRRGRDDAAMLDDAKLKVFLKAILAWAKSWEPTALAFKAAKAKAIKGRKPSLNPRKTEPRTIEHTGTCGICAKNVKLEGTKEVIYDHGFSIRSGYRQGKCFGVGHEPIERSPKVMLVFIEAVIADILMFKTSLEETKAVPDDTVRYTDPRTKRPVLMKEQRAMWKSHLQDAESMHRDFSRRVKEWKARKLPDGRK